MRIDVLTLFPDVFDNLNSFSIIKKAIDSNKVVIKTHNLREFADNSRKVDDYPYGGFPGMVIKIEPIDRCIEQLKETNNYDEIIYLTPDGDLLNQKTANHFSTLNNIIIICGHYKGIDHRVREHIITKEISIGEFVVSGGELPAAVLCDSIIRLLPGIIGDESSALSDTFQDNLLSPPIYTRPEIYKGMKLIDDKLGGTTPLDIIVKFGEAEKSNYNDEDDFEDWGDDDQNVEKYWFTRDKIDKIDKIHDYLDSLPAVGKVLSFASIIEVATQLNNNKPLGTLEMGVLYTKIPETIKKEIIDPYISIKDNEARISLRVKDSLPDLRRNDLINQINFDLQNKLNLKEEEFKLAGVLILFNNLLQSLFKSQILTLGFVMIGIFAMFLILFRNLKISILGVVPNFIAAFFILGIIGIMGIPLDMMTITIAAITIGIAVDNSIHYIYRFKEEYAELKDYKKTIKLCHSAVGVAILNTSITIVFGFSILVFSNFIPTIYFGVFTGIAMLLAMISVLTLLPSLILVTKPFDDK